MFKIILSLFHFFNSIYSININNSLMDQYNQYILDYNKTFNHHNFDIFKDNILLINDHNQKNNSYSLDINVFADQEPHDTNHYFRKGNGTYSGDNKINNIVSLSIDWRKKGVITNVKDQGKCGSCWSFSATGSIEAINAIDTGELKNVSEQQLMDCSIDYGNKGCQGGAMDNAFKYVIDNGICSEEEYPYTAEQGFCNQCNTTLKINNYKDIIPNDEKLLKRVVAQQPVSVAIQANLKSFQLYSNGIYSDPNCGTKLDHGVLIVGYGYDLYHNMDYWIIKNSWGPNWGENGYIRIQRNIDNPSGLCGITIQPSIPLI